MTYSNGLGRLVEGVVVSCAVAAALSLVPGGEGDGHAPRTSLKLLRTRISPEIKFNFKVILVPICSCLD